MHWGTMSPRSWLTSNDNKHSSRVNRSFIYFLPVRLILDSTFNSSRAAFDFQLAKNASHLLFNLSDSGAHTHETARIRERTLPEQASSCTLDLFDNLGKSNIIERVSRAERRSGESRCWDKSISECKFIIAVQPAFVIVQHRAYQLYSPLECANSKLSCSDRVVWVSLMLHIH